MAPVLLCPDCGTKHPIDGVNGTAFPCKGCGRTLKVPEQAQVAAVDPDLPWPSAAPAVAPVAAMSAAVAPAAEPNVTSVMPAQPIVQATPAPIDPVPAAVAPAAVVPAAKPRRSRTNDAVPSRWIRFALWIVAVPLGFLIVFAVARLIGILSSNQVEDVALAEGWTRFMPIARLLPIVALVTAGLVQGAVFAITRFRASRRTAPAKLGESAGAKA